MDNGLKFRLLFASAEYAEWPYGCFQHNADSGNSVYFNEQTTDPDSSQNSLRVCAGCVNVQALQGANGSTTVTDSPAADNPTPSPMPAVAMGSPSVPSSSAALSRHEPESVHVLPDSKSTLQLITTTGMHTWTGNGMASCGVDFMFNLTPKRGLRLSTTPMKSSVWSGAAHGASWNLVLTPVAVALSSAAEDVDSVAQGTTSDLQ